MSSIRFVADDPARHKAKLREQLALAAEETNQRRGQHAVGLVRSVLRVKTRPSAPPELPRVAHSSDPTDLTHAPSGGSSGAAAAQDADAPEAVATLEEAAQFLEETSPSGANSTPHAGGVSWQGAMEEEEVLIRDGVLEDGPQHQQKYQTRAQMKREWGRSAIFDIESGLWASPFFGAFSTIRFHMLCLVGQLVLVICSVYTEDGLAFPGWIIFSLAMAAIGTGFPAWWEPMTNKHLNMHIIVSVISALVSLWLAIVMRDRYQIVSSQRAGQADRLASLHIGTASLQLLGGFFAFKTKANAAQVDGYIRARLEEEKQSRRRALAIHSMPMYPGDGAHGGYDDFDNSEYDPENAHQWAVSDDMLRMPGGGGGGGSSEGGGADYFDPDLRKLDGRMQQFAYQTDLLMQKNGFLVKSLAQNHSRNQEQTEEMRQLAKQATEANSACILAVSKLAIFEKELSSTRKLTQLKASEVDALQIRLGEVQGLLGDSSSSSGGAAARSR
jgi:hypothetical protein